MKKLMFALVAAASVCAYAESETELEKQDAPIFWGFSSWGFYSGYQLYGNLVNCEPVIQSYSELNANLPWDLGHVGFAVFMNSDLTGQRGDTYRRAFNEMDPMIHWEKTFWFDDNQTWGLDYRTWFCWYIYPNDSDRPYGGTKTTWDWDHTISLVNPYVTPYVTWIREYSKGANLLDFGLRRPTQITDEFSICPSASFIWREAQYCWCFPTAGTFQNQANSGIATMRLELDANYQICSWFGIWAKVAYCCTVDPDLRDVQDVSSGNNYAKHSDFAWGGVGVCLSF